MISAVPRAHVAVYHGPGAKHPELPVIAWSDDGVPLALDPETGHLVHATDIEGFSQILETSARTIIPGGGWLVTYGPGDDGGEPQTVPVVAWVIDQDGNGYPVATNENGDLDPVSAMTGQPCRIHHPDMSPAEQPLSRAPTGR